MPLTRILICLPDASALQIQQDKKVVLHVEVLVGDGVSDTEAGDFPGGDTQSKATLQLIRTTTRGIREVPDAAFVVGVVVLKTRRVGALALICMFCTGQLKLLATAQNCRPHMWSHARENEGKR